MLRKLRIAMLAMFIAAIAPAPQAYALCVSPICLFKLALKCTPGLPVMDFSTIPVILSELPTMIVQKVQSELKMLGDNLVRNVRVSTEIPSDFKIVKIDVPISVPTADDLVKSADFSSFTNGLSASGAGSSSGGDVDMTDPQAVAAAAESLLINPGTDKMARDALKQKRDKYYQDNVVEVYGLAGHLQAQLSEMPQVLEDLSATASSDGDENQSVRANFTARQVMSQIIGIKHQAVAAQAQLKGSKVVAQRLTPKDGGIVSNVYGESGGFGMPGAFDGLADLAASALPAIEDLGDALGDVAKVAEAKEYVAKAFDAHNAIYSLYESRALVEKHARTIERHEEILTNLRLSDNCNISQLSAYYDNPSKVWYGTGMSGKDVNEYDARGGLSKFAIDRYDALVADSALPEPDFGGDPNNPEMEFSESNYDDQVQAAEAFSRVAWDVGREVLIDLYADQEGWGNVSGSKELFDLWVDQKKLYDQYWTDKYKRIKDHYRYFHNAVIPLGPAVSATQKYQRKYHATVVELHNQFIQQITASTGYSPTAPASVTWAAPTLPAPVAYPSPAPDFSAPKSPPKALPPYKEIVYMDERDIEDNNYVPYPEMPEPWVQQFEIIAGVEPYGDYSSFVSGGELDEMVDLWGGGNFVKFDNDFYDEDNEDSDIIPLAQNRVSGFLSLRQAEMDMEPQREEAEKFLTEFDADIRSELTKAGYTPPANFNVANNNDFNTAIERLLAYKMDELAKLETYIGTLKDAPAVVQQRLVEVQEAIDAMKQDADCNLMMNFETAGLSNLGEEISTGAADREATQLYQAQAADAEAALEFEVACPIL